LLSKFLQQFKLLKKQKNNNYKRKREGNDHSHSTNKKTLTVSLVIITVYMAVEVIGGLLTNSLALLADAGHMLSDAVSLFIALMAFKFSSKVADYGKTYGYKRFEILAAVINGATLILISGYIIYEAIERFQNHRKFNQAVC
jgi:cobalt-zinc-cadmium efflux system protein